jgi:hypothetical protein
LAVPVATYLAMCNGLAGEVLRMAGDATWNFTAFCVENVSQIEPNTTMVAQTLASLLEKAGELTSAVIASSSSWLVERESTVPEIGERDGVKRIDPEIQTNQLAERRAEQESWKQLNELDMFFAAAPEVIEDLPHSSQSSTDPVSSRSLDIPTGSLSSVQDTLSFKKSQAAVSNSKTESAILPPIEPSAIWELSSEDVESNGAPTSAIDADLDTDQPVAFSSSHPDGVGWSPVSPNGLMSALGLKDVFRAVQASLLERQQPYSPNEMSANANDGPTVAVVDPVRKTPEERKRDADNSLLSLEIKQNVPLDAIQGAALTALVASLAVGTDLSISLCFVVPLTTYLSICRGYTGEFVRTIGEVTWMFSSYCFETMGQLDFSKGAVADAATSMVESVRETTSTVSSWWATRMAKTTRVGDFGKEKQPVQERMKQPAERHAEGKAVNRQSMELEKLSSAAKHEETQGSSAQDPTLEFRPTRGGSFSTVPQSLARASRWSEDLDSGNQQADRNMAKNEGGGAFGTRSERIITEPSAVLTAEEVNSDVLARIQESAGLFEQIMEQQTLTSNELIREVRVMNSMNATAPDLFFASLEP